MHSIMVLIAVSKAVFREEWLFNFNICFVKRIEKYCNISGFFFFYTIHEVMEIELICQNDNLSN